MTLDSLLCGLSAAERPAPALVTAERTLSYAALDGAVERAHTGLAALAGEELKGARVAVIAPNVPALAVGLFAVWRAGAVAVPLSARLREHDLAGVLADCGALATLTVAADRRYSFADALAALAPRLPTLRGTLFMDAGGELVGSDHAGGGDAGRGGGPAGGGDVAGVREPAAPLDPSIAAVLYTSGSTGAPKGALTRHSAELQTARALADVLALRADDRTALVIPATHAFGLGALLAALAARSTTVLVEAGVSAEPLAVALAAHAATVVHGSPAVFEGLLRASALGGVRGGFVGGAASPPELLERLDAAGTTILNVFGMTELGAAAACRPDDPPQARHTTVGRPLDGFEFRARDGELQVRGPHVTPGYHGRPELTAEAFDGDWFRTGDLGELDADGRVRIAGRAKDVVHVGGFSVFPAEVEGFLMTHPDVAQAAVIGVTHARMGEAMKAFVVARAGSGLEPADLIRFARPRIAGYKIPYAIELVGEIPRLESGKPDRAALGDARPEGKVAGGASPGGLVPPPPPGDAA